MRRAGDARFKKGSSGRFGWNPNKILKLWHQKHYFMPFLMDLKSMNDTSQSIWRALFGNFEGTFVYGLNEGSSLPSLPLDARLLNN